MEFVYHVPIKRSNAKIVDHEDHLMESYSYVYLGVMKKALQILHVTTYKRIFAGGNLMVAISRAMGNYKETFK